MKWTKIIGLNNVSKHDLYIFYGRLTSEEKRVFEWFKFHRPTSIGQICGHSIGYSSYYPCIKKDEMTNVFGFLP